MASPTILDKVGAVCGRAVRHQAERLGLDNRMNLARTYNKHRNAGLIDYRQGLLSDPAYLDYTSGVEAFDLRDGWSLPGDALSFADHPIVSDAQAILSENRQPGSLKGFMVNHLTMDDLKVYPSFIEAALHPKVIKTAASYLGMFPILSSVKLLVSSPANYDSFRSSQLYHLDHADKPLLKMIINISPVTSESGPFCFLPTPVSQAAKQTLNYGKWRSAYRVTDERMYAVADSSKMVKLTGDAGDVAFIDTSHCFHYGSRNATRDRRIVMYSFSTPARTDFRRPIDYSDAFACESVLQKALLDPHFRGGSL